MILYIFYCILVEVASLRRLYKKHPCLYSAILGFFREAIICLFFYPRYPRPISSHFVFLFDAPQLLNAAIPHSAFRISHFAFRIPHSWERTHDNSVVRRRDAVHTAFARCGASRRRLVGWVDSPPSQATARQPSLGRRLKILFRLSPGRREMRKCIKLPGAL